MYFLKRQFVTAFFSSFLTTYITAIKGITLIEIAIKNIIIKNKQLIINWQIYYHLNLNISSTSSIASGKVF